MTEKSPDGKPGAEAIRQCQVCQRDPDRMNSHIAECSHVDCPNRKHEMHAVGSNVVEHQDRLTGLYGWPAVIRGKRLW